MRWRDTRWAFSFALLAFEWGADGLTADFHGTVHDPRDVNDILDRRVVEHPCLYDSSFTRK